MITELNKRPGALNGLEEPLKRKLGKNESPASRSVRFVINKIVSGTRIRGYVSPTAHLDVVKKKSSREN
jgi:hypothetical protein